MIEYTGNRLRSLLFVPGDQPDLVAKALKASADAVIVDLEDAVAPERKAFARAHLENLDPNPRPTLMVRVNAVGSREFADDIDAAFQAPIASVLLPKTERVDAIEYAHRIVQKTETAANITQPTPFVLLVESALGIANCLELLDARVDRPLWSAFGGGDYSFDLGLQSLEHETELLWARSRLVVAARANDRLAPFDTIHANYRDAQGFKASCERSRALGFRGRMLIHPSQIEVANVVYDTAQDVEWAQRMLAHYSGAGGRGAFGIDGELVDYAHVRRAQTILRREGLSEANSLSVDQHIKSSPGDDGRMADE